VVLVAVLLALSVSFAGVRGYEADLDGDYYDNDFSELANCPEYSNCKACTEAKGCGWCPALNECLEGTANGSTDGSCQQNGTGWHINATECRNCSAFTDCTSCTGAYNGSVCGWCESFPVNITVNTTKTINATCWEGGKEGPYYHAWPTCPRRDWLFDSNSCDDDDSEKRKLAIIIGLSVAGGLFVLAVVATIAFVIIKRAQRSRGYQAINESA